jgi:hypothetical protein
MTEPTSQLTSQPFSPPEGLKRLAYGAAAAATVLLGLSVATDLTRSLTNSLVLFVFTVTLGLGCLFLVALEYTVNATWSIPLRRISEHLAGLLPFSLLLALPVLFGLGRLYEWTHGEVMASDPILQAKIPYLNVPFFLARFAIFYLVWFTGYVVLVGGSIRQDRTPDPAFGRRARRFSPVFIILLVITITFASFDWIMSLSPHWYSSIFGIYLLVGAMVAGIALTTLAAATLKLKGFLPAEIGRDHFYNLGALLFALNTAWAYIAFAQFLLIWYGNLPHETVWYAVRSRGGWGTVSGVLIIGHFVVPFLALLSRSAKTDLRRLRWVAAWVLGAHVLDVYWLISPSVRTTGTAIGWQELWIPLAAIALGILVWIRQSKNSPMIPTGDPRLEHALHFHL